MMREEVDPTSFPFYIYFYFLAHLLFRFRPVEWTGFAHPAELSVMSFLKADFYVISGYFALLK